MGIEYYTCFHCDDVLNDHDGFDDTCDSCGLTICYDCQVKLKIRAEAKYKSLTFQPYFDEDNYLAKCPYCLGEIITDSQIVQYLLTKFNLNEENVIAEIKKSLHK